MDQLVSYFSTYSLAQVLWTILGVGLFAYSLYRGFSMRGRNSDESKQKGALGKLCQSPNCVRCNKYITVLGNATDRLFQYLESHTDCSKIQTIIDTFTTSHADYRIFSQLIDEHQQPTVYHLPHLEAKPLWSASEFSTDMRLICENIHIIWEEFSRVYIELDESWTVNSTPSGVWSVYYLYNQGLRMESNCADCPQTAALLQQLPSFMGRCLFCNAGFSVLQPATDIEEHCGPTNIRIRCHLGLRVPPDCCLRVADRTLQWHEGQALFFDDSYQHAAYHHGNQDASPRAVFLLDLWHPQLGPEERDVLSHIFTAQAEEQ